MNPDELRYEVMKSKIGIFEHKGREEARAFLNWFLENIFRLDPIEADDCICDNNNDRGVDAIYVDKNQEEIVVFQAKTKQKESSIGDSALRDLAGTLTQFGTVSAVDELIKGGGNEELKAVIARLKVREYIDQGFTVIGAFVCNQPLDQNGLEFAKVNGRLRVYDRIKIASEFIDLDADGGIHGEFAFDITYTGHLSFQTKNGIKTYILPVKAKELINMAGIDDGTLFSQNVRQSLGNTKINRALRQNVIDKDEHQYFTLYHNGVTILCKSARSTSERLYISDYVVVNGAQSISTFKKSASALTDDLRVVAKIIELNDSRLAKAITTNSNNQNAIKARDLKSTNEIQLRLKQEFSTYYNGKYEYEIKRGQDIHENIEVITNEEAGRLLLSFDLHEPELCHQLYKLFDEKYTEIFARPSVTAHRIILIFEIMKVIEQCLDRITNKPMSKYGLTKFFLLYVVSRIIQIDNKSKEFIKTPDVIIEKYHDKFISSIKESVFSIIIDLNYEIINKEPIFDYKSDLKSPAKVKELGDALIKSFEKDIARGKIELISKCFS